MPYVIYCKYHNNFIFKYIQSTKDNERRWACLMKINDLVTSHSTFCGVAFCLHEGWKEKCSLCEPGAWAHYCYGQCLVTVPFE